MTEKRFQEWNDEDWSIKYVKDEYYFKTPRATFIFNQHDFNKIVDMILTAPHPCCMDKKKICDGCSTCNDLNEEYIQDIMRGF